MLQINDIALNHFELKFLDFVTQNNLFDKKTKLILGVSGGVDSMVMLYILSKLGFTFSVGHVNFNLRKSESDAEEKLVKITCEQKNIEFFSQHYDTRKFAKDYKISLEMAARELRYKWFNELSEKHQFEAILVAHNKNDHAETVLLNLCRGTSIKGLRGLKAKNERIIRPLLCFSRNEIETYAKHEKIDFLIDSSNYNLIHSRNRIRLKVIPELEKVNPSLIETIFHNSIHLSHIEKLTEEIISKEINQIIRRYDNMELIDLKKLETFNHSNLLLFQIFSIHNLTQQQLIQIKKLCNSQTGKTLFFNNIKVLKDRDYLIIQKYSKFTKKTIFIENKFPLTIVENEYIFKAKLVEFTNSSYLKHPENAFLDYSRLSFPLILRNWENRDRFKPFGLNHSKLISDFLTDIKIPSRIRKNIKVIESNGIIVWVVGYRIHNEYKITPNTKSILHLSIESLVYNIVI